MPARPAPKKRLQRNPPDAQLEDTNAMERRNLNLGKPSMGFGPGGGGLSNAAGRWETAEEAARRAPIALSTIGKLAAGAGIGAGITKLFQNRDKADKPTPDQKGDIAMGPDSAAIDKAWKSVGGKP